jgi:hypothetical protein
MLAAGAAPAAGAVDLNPAPAVASTGANATPSISFPVFVDASRFALMQAAWRSRIDGAGRTQLLPVTAVSAEPEIETLNEARRTLSRGEEVSLKAIDVRARAEELSRRFAIEVGSESKPAAQDDDAAVAVAPEAPAIEAASISSEAAPADGAAPEVASAPVEAQETATIQQVSVQQVSLGSKMPSDVAPASMLGGPSVEKASADDAAPVIEDMATKPHQPAKRAPANVPARRVTAQAATEPPTLFGIFSSWGSSESEEAPANAKTPEKDLMPTEIRSFGWNAQP